MVKVIGTVLDCPGNSGVPLVNEICVAEGVTCGYCALFTTSDIAADVLAASFASPPYTAVIAWVPTDNVELVRVAAPLLNVCVPKVAPAFLNVTVPVGTFPEAEVTVTEKAIDCPKLVGSALAVSVVVVLNALIVSATIGEMLLEKVPSPA